jgi:hypothetical protein
VIILCDTPIGTFEVRGAQGLEMAQTFWRRDGCKNIVQCLHLAKPAIKMKRNAYGASWVRAVPQENSHKIADVLLDVVQNTAKHSGMPAVFCFAMVKLEPYSSQPALPNCATLTCQGTPGRIPIKLFDALMIRINAATQDVVEQLNTPVSKHASRRIL